MTPRLLLLSLSAGVVFAGSCFADCIPVAGNKILGRDLARADSRLAALPVDLTVGFAPAPGGARVFTVPELQRLARANGIVPFDAASVCFALKMTELREEDVTAAMHSALSVIAEGQTAELKIVDLPRMSVPEGPIEFPIDGLEPAGPSAAGAQIWRGYVKYAETRRAICWARVSLTTSYSIVVADRDLPVNNPINSAALRVEKRTGPLRREKTAARIEDAAGRIPQRAIKAGESIALSNLMAAPDVRRGESVTVEVRSGQARLQLDAIAETSANEGDVIELRNPSSGKSFRAKLDAGSKAVVVVAGTKKL